MVGALGSSHHSMDGGTAPVACTSTSSAMTDGSPANRPSEMILQSDPKPPTSRAMYCRVRYAKGTPRASTRIRVVGRAPSIIEISHHQILPWPGTTCVLPGRAGRMAGGTGQRRKSPDLSCCRSTWVDIRMGCQPFVKPWIKEAVDGAPSSTSPTKVVPMNCRTWSGPFCRGW